VALVLALLVVAVWATPVPAGAGADPALAFPPSLERYQGEEGLSLWGVLAHRVRAEPLNWSQRRSSRSRSSTPSPRHASRHWPIMCPGTCARRG
jgi:hypothetical protein